MLKIKILNFLIESYGRGHWKKLSAEAPVLDSDGDKFIAEIHYYEALGVGRYDFKIVDKVRNIDKEDLI